MLNLPQAIGATYLINLPARRDRLNSAIEQFERVGWTSPLTNIQLFPGLRYSQPAGFPSPAVRGCFHSHLECLRLASAGVQNGAMILEDDIGLTTSLPSLTPSIVSWLENESWDFVYFGHQDTGDVPRANKRTKGTDLRFDLWVGDLLTAHFYALSRRILARVIEHLERVSQGQEGDQEYGPMPVDGAYNIFRRKNPDVRCFIVTPKLGWQMSSRSDITPHRLDRFTMLRPVNSFLRTLKRRRTMRGS